jgi:porin
MKGLFKYFFALPLFFTPLQAQTQQEGPLSEWSSFKQNLGDKGFSFNINYTGEFINSSGGIKTGSSYIHFLDITTETDLNALTGINAGVFTFRLLGKKGSSPNEYAGSAQGVSNIEAPDLFRLYEVKLENTFFNERLSVMAGLADLNAEFDVKETSAPFINPSHGIGIDYAQTGVNGPCIYPYTGLAARIGYNITDQVSFKVAAFDGVPGKRGCPEEAGLYLDNKEGALLAAEISMNKGAFEESEESFIHFGAGGWTYTSRLDCEYNADIHKGVKHSNWGTYLFAEGKIASLPNPLYGFIRAGAANAELNPYGYFAAGGLLMKGVFTDNQVDNIGLAFALAGAGSQYRNYALQQGTMAGKYELNIETTYSITVLDILEFQPDAQYVVNPADASSNAFALGMRFKLNL